MTVNCYDDREFWRRHKRKVYVTLGVFGSGYLLYKLYDARRSSLNDLEKQLAYERENEELVKAQLRLADSHNLLLFMLLMKMNPHLCDSFLC